MKLLTIRVSHQINIKIAFKPSQPFTISDKTKHFLIQTNKSNRNWFRCLSSVLGARCHYQPMSISLLPRSTIDLFSFIFINVAMTCRILISYEHETHVKSKPERKTKTYTQSTSN